MKHPNSVWPTDITYTRTLKGYLHWAVETVGLPRPRNQIALKTLTVDCHRHRRLEQVSPRAFATLQIGGESIRWMC